MVHQVSLPSFNIWTQSDLSNKPGTYKICTPIVQLYYTQFISDPLDRAIIKGCDDFTGIALVDVDPYVPNQAQPDGTGVNW